MTAAAPSGALVLELSCPKCGAPVLVDDETAALSCAHCGSLLAVAAPGRQEAYVATSLLGDDEDFRDMVLEYRVEAFRSQLIGSLRDREGNPPPDFIVESRVRAFEDELRARLSASDVRRFFVPYWHIGGWVVQAVLGRKADGPKKMRVRGYLVEHTVPAYDTAAHDLRDRGLRMARARVRPLTARVARESGPFLPWVPVPERSYREIDRWLKDPLEAEVDATARHGALVGARRILVYRPYAVARLRGGTDTQEWVLADGQFRTIAGYPAAPEVTELVKGAMDDPLRTSGESWRRVFVSASRCPDCGHDARPGRTDRVTICANCHLALRPTAKGLALVPIAHAQREGADLDAAYVPFWRFPLASTKGATASLEDLWRAAFTGAAPRGPAPRGTHVFVPAVRLLGTPAGDRAFHALTAWVHAAPPEVHDGKVPLGGRATFLGASLDEDEARETAGLVPFAVFGDAAAARLTGRAFQRTLQAARLELGPGRLALVPFARAGGDLVADPGGPAVPDTLLRGGPAIEAQRVSVHAARRAAGEPR